ncbi:Rz1-like lysis system protein LysC [Vibrio astriarenae]|uniref:Rz1-like lysis system protein LysC n=1 Tax=Vibrio astriarenae TaxID=1481923 RepID=UPI0037360729
MALPIMVTQLVACSNNNPTITITTTEYIYKKPPLPLVEDCEEHVYNGNAWNDVAEYARTLQLEIAICKKQIEALKEVYEGSN